MDSSRPAPIVDRTDLTLNHKEGLTLPWVTDHAFRILAKDFNECPLEWEDWQRGTTPSEIKIVDPMASESEQTIKPPRVSQDGFGVAG